MTETPPPAPRGNAEPVSWGDHSAVLFDLDGVITPTAEVHMRAWEQMFNDYLTTEHPEQPPYTSKDYYDFVDGKPRYDGVRDFLTARELELPEGTPEDAPFEETVCGLGNRKNEAFNEVLARDGVAAYPGSVALLDHLKALGVPLAVVSSSANAPDVLRSAGLLERFVTVVDGKVAKELGLPGKPAPDTFQHAADELGAARDGAVVIEDALSGVKAGASGGFAMTVGVDRGVGRDALRNAGADLVVADLSELVP